MIIRDQQRITHCQRLERALYNIDDFSPDYAVFPRAVFRKEFAVRGFLPFNDWFHTEAAYGQLQQFIQATGGSQCFSAVPHFFLLPPVAITAQTKHADYLSAHTFADESHHRGAGLRQSAEVFYYSGDARWAMVADLTHGLLICGMVTTVQAAFTAAFGPLLPVRSLIDQWTEREGAAPDQQAVLLAAYG